MSWKWFCSLAFVLVATGCCENQSTSSTSSEAARPPSLERTVSLHFIGGTSIGTDTNAAFLKSILALPESVALKEQTLAKLARVPYELAKRRSVMTTNDFAALIRPLWDDLLSSESFLEVSGATNGTLELGLAIRLERDRAELWSTNLRETLTAWTHLPATDIGADGVNGWELKKHKAPNLFQFVQVGDWVVTGFGQDNVALVDELVARIKTDGRPCAAATNYWVSAQGDWSWLGKYMIPSDEMVLPNFSNVHATLSAANNDLFLRAMLTRDEPFNWKPESWRVPTNMIHDSLISFTAMQGVSEWLSGQKPFRSLKMEPRPNQFYGWALRGVPLQTFAALKVDNASNALEQLAPQLMSINTNLHGRMSGYIAWRTNHTALMWHGLPFIVPFIQPVREASEDYLFAGIFPNTPRRTPIPEDLLNQIIGRTNLVYYHWEIIAERMPGWRNISQLFCLLNDYQQLDGKSVTAQWLNAVTPQLGNVVTEVTVTNPRQLDLIRKSPIGLTALELMVLANWLETPDFPLDRLFQPLERRPMIIQGKPVKIIKRP